MPALRGMAIQQISLHTAFWMFYLEHGRHPAHLWTDTRTGLAHYGLPSSRICFVSPKTLLEQADPSELRETINTLSMKGLKLWPTFAASP